MTATELIAEMVDIIDMIRQDCLCGFPEYCRDCYYNQEAKKIIAKAYSVLGCDDPGQSRHGSVGKKPPQGGCVNTPRPPQDMRSEKKVCRFIYRGKGKPDPIPEDAFSNELPWQPGPAQGGGLPPEWAQEILVYTGGLYDHVKYRHNEFMNVPWEEYMSWDRVQKWLIIK
jgi:hypothetical protein